MDPLSISLACLSLGQTLFKSVDGVRSAVKATKDVEESVRALEALGHGCADVLKKLAEALKSEVLSAPGNEDLFSSVHVAVQSCEATVDGLDAKLKPLQGGSRGFRQMFKAYRLHLQKDDIDTIKSQLQTHSVNLQLALQTVNVIITASIPSAIAARQTDRFDKLEQMIATLQLHGGQPNSRPAIAASAGTRLRLTAGDESEDQALHEVVLDQNTTRLLGSAASVLSDSISRVGGPVRSVATHEESNYIDESNVPSSEFGAPLNVKQVTGIHNWIQQAPSTVNEAQRPISPVEEQSSDENDELDSEVASRMTKKGYELLSEGNFSDAYAYLDRSLTYVRFLRFKAHAALLMDTHTTYAICCSRLGKYEEAESSFITVITALTSNEMTTSYLSDTSDRYFVALYELAALELRFHKLDAAMMHCRQVIKHSRQAGKDVGPAKTNDDQTYHNSVWLMGLIHWAKGERIDAFFYSDKLPVELRISEQDFDKTLKTLLESPHIEPTPSQTPTKYVNNKKDISEPSNFGRFDLESVALPTGIQNQGATGYLNVVMQTFYYIKAIPQTLFRMRTKKGSTVWGLQRLFYSLRTSSGSVSTEELTTAFGWGTKQLNEGQDCQNFFEILLDGLKSEAIDRLFRSQVATRIICTDVEFSASRVEHAYSIQLNLTDSLEHSLEEYTKAEMYDGDNKYYTGDEFGLQPAKRDIVFESFADVLWLTIKRFEYDFNLDTMCKVADYCEYPEEFDAAPFLATPPREGTELWVYTLMTVIVHFGTLGEGLYFSITRPSLDGPFYKFNDEKVSEVSRDEAFERNFGKRRTATEKADSEGNWNSRYASSRDAYILVYIRKSRAKQLLQDWSPEDVRELIS